MSTRPNMPSVTDRRRPTVRAVLAALLLAGGASPALDAADPVRDAMRAELDRRVVMRPATGDDDDRAALLEVRRLLEPDEVAGSALDAEMLRHLLDDAEALAPWSAEGLVLVDACLAETATGMRAEPVDVALLARRAALALRWARHDEAWRTGRMLAAIQPTMPAGIDRGTTMRDLRDAGLDDWSWTTARRTARSRLAERLREDARALAAGWGSARTPAYLAVQAPIEHGRLDEALAMARRFEGDDRRMALWLVARAHAETGDIDAALAIAREFDASQRNRLLDSLARGAAERDHADAMRVGLARMFGDDVPASTRAALLLGDALSNSDSGAEATARAVEAIGDERVVLDALLELARGRAGPWVGDAVQARLLDRVVEHARLASDGIACCDAAELLVAAGRFDRARTLLDERRAMLRAAAPDRGVFHELMRVSGVAHDLGLDDAAAARAALVDARRVALAIDADVAADAADAPLRFVADRQIALGDLDGATRTAVESMHRPAVAMAIRAAIVEAQCAARDFDAATATMAAMELDASPGAWARATTALVRADRLDLAAPRLETLMDDEAGRGCLKEVASAIAERCGVACALGLLAPVLDHAAPAISPEQQRRMASNVGTVRTIHETAGADAARQWLEAYGSARRAGDGMSRATLEGLVAAIARAGAAAGDLDGAECVASTFGLDPSVYAEEKVDWLSRHGDVAGALAVACASSRDTTRVNAYGRIAAMLDDDDARPDPVGTPSRRR